MITADIKNNKPFKHEQITRQIIENIQNGNLTPGQRMPSLRQLAKELNCSYLTVNRSLEKLEEMGLIEKRPRSGNYIKQTAVNLVNETPEKTVQAPTRTDKLGLLFMPDSASPFLNGLMKSIHKICEEMEITLNIRTVTDYSRSNLTHVKGLMSQECCSIIIPTLPTDQNVSNLHELVKSSMLPITIPDLIPGLEEYTCARPFRHSTNIKSHTTLACDYFKKLGYSNIAILGPESDMFQNMMVDYTMFINKNRIQSYIGIVDVREADDFAGIIDNWKHMAGDLAVVCCYDEMAMRFMSIAHKKGLRIPEDLGVMGYNNIPETPFADPPLSTMQCPYDHIAENLIFHALRKVGVKLEERNNKYIEKLIVRESCGGRLRFGDKIDEIEKNINEEQKR